MSMLYGFVSNVEQIKSVPGKNGAKSVLEFTIKEPGDYGAWVNCSLWGERAEKLAPHITQGLFLIVNGNLGSEGWNSSNDNSVKTKVTFSVSTIEFGGYSKSAFRKGLVPMDQQQQNGAQNSAPQNNAPQQQNTAPMGGNPQHHAAQAGNPQMAGYNAGFDEDDCPF